MMFRLGDEPSECRLIDSRGRRRPLLFVASSAPRLLRLATNLTEVTILMKEVDAFPYSVAVSEPGFTLCSPHALISTISDAYTGYVDMTIEKGRLEYTFAFFSI
ncbi:hypothetical protein OSTOST_03650 [Ostertagia ostertagi]